MKKTVLNWLASDWVLAAYYTGLTVANGWRAVELLKGARIMFLCDECHDPRQHFDLFRSRGLCESCGKPANCIDCHRLSCPPPKKRKKPARKSR